MSASNEKEYFSRIHRAEDYIEAHLGDTLRLEEIAKVACFSSFHFHRIFTFINGETLYQFILRLRLERAANLLSQPVARPITQMALDLGFGSAASFARAFQADFGMSASVFRKNCKMKSKDWKDLESLGIYLAQQVNPQLSRRKLMKNINDLTPKKPISHHIVDLPLRTFAYIRHVGPYAGDSALFQRMYGQLCQWAGPNGYLEKPETEMLCIYHDNPDITKEDKLRISVGITVAPGTSVPPPFQTMEIPRGKYIVAKFDIDASEYMNAWAWIMNEWMPQSGWQCDDRPCYEKSLNDPAQHPQHRHIIEICEPVKPL